MNDRSRSSCASCAIRRSRVEMLPRFGDPDICPLDDSVPRSPLPSTGSHRVGSPTSLVLRGSLTPCDPSRRARLPSPGGTACASASLRSRGLWTPPTASPGLWSSGSRKTGLVLRRRSQGLPGSWRDLGGRMPCSMTPAEPTRQANAARRCCRPLTVRERPRRHSHFRG